MGIRKLSSAIEVKVKQLSLKDGDILHIDNTDQKLSSSELQSITNGVNALLKDIYKDKVKIGLIVTSNGEYKVDRADKMLRDKGWRKVGSPNKMDLI